MKKILIIGSTVADIIINLPKLPTTEEDINIDSQQMSLGGCAYNVSDMVRHFGAPYVLFSPIGTGIYGDFIRNKLAVKGLSSPIPTPSIPNGCCYCFVEANGERTFVCDHGAEYLFQKEWFDDLNTSEISSIYICGLEIEDRTGPTIIDFLEEHSNIPIFFAPGPRINYIDRLLLDRIFALNPIIHLNKEELLCFTNCDYIEAGALALHQMTNNTVIITSGSNGAYYFEEGELMHVPPAKVSNIVDTIGAGDGHIGAILASLSKGHSMYESVKLANSASALIVGNKGAILSDEAFESTIEI